MSVGKPKARTWSLKEYYRLADLGMFRGQRVELMEGVIVKMAPQKNFHVIGIDLAKQALEAAFGTGHWVRIQAPLHLSRRSAPEPDLAVVPGTSRTYTATNHPTSALLIVEVSDTTLSYDRRRKASLYARAGLADYWIVDLIHRRLEIRRNPIPDASQRYGFRYADVTVLAPTDSATPLAAPQANILVADLLP